MKLTFFKITFRIEDNLIGSILFCQHVTALSLLLLWEIWVHVKELRTRREWHRERQVVCAQKDIHQHREESSRARGMLASRAKSESLA